MSKLDTVLKTKPHFDDSFFFDLQVRVDQMSSQWSGSLRIGLTTMAISDTTSPAQVPPSADQITSKVTWVVAGSTVLKCGQVMRENYAPALERLQVRFVFFLRYRIDVGVLAYMLVCRWVFLLCIYVGVCMPGLHRYLPDLPMYLSDKCLCQHKRNQNYSSWNGTSFFVPSGSSWYNCPGWLGIKHQITSFLLPGAEASNVYVPLLMLLHCSRSNCLQVTDF